MKTQYKNDLLEGIGFEEVTPGTWGKSLMFHGHKIDVHVKPDHLMSDKMIDYAFGDAMQWAYKTAWEARTEQVKQIRKETDMNQAEAVTVEAITKAHNTKSDCILNLHMAVSRKAISEAMLIKTKAGLTPEGKNADERKQFVLNATLEETQEVQDASEDLRAAETQLKLAQNELNRLQMILDWTTR